MSRMVLVRCRVPEDRAEELRNFAASLTPAAVVPPPPPPLPISFVLAKTLCRVRGRDNSKEWHAAAEAFDGPDGTDFPAFTSKGLRTVARLSKIERRADGFWSKRAAVVRLWFADLPSREIAVLARVSRESVDAILADQVDATRALSLLRQAI